MINQAVESFGKLDILVCNAASCGTAPCSTPTEEEWDSVIRVHLQGPLRADPLGDDVLA